MTGLNGGRILHLLIALTVYVGLVFLGYGFQNPVTFEGIALALGIWETIQWGFIYKNKIVSRLWAGLVITVTLFWIVALAQQAAS